MSQPQTLLQQHQLHHHQQQQQQHQQHQQQQQHYQKQLQQQQKPQQQKQQLSTGVRKLNYSSSFKGRKVSHQESKDEPFSRNDSLRHSTGSIKGKKMDRLMSSPAAPRNLNGHKAEGDDTVDGPTSPSVHNLIKGFQSKIVSNSVALDTTDYGTPGYVAESPPESHQRSNSKRKISLRNATKKGKMSTDDARYSILQSLGVSPFAGNENRSVEKSYGYLDIQSLFFDFQNATTLKCTFDEGSVYTKKLSGASAAFVKGNQNRRKIKAGEVDSSRVESMIDEGDSKENELLLGCPYFRNEIAEPEDSKGSGGDNPSNKNTKDIAKLISMFNRNRSFENLRNDSYELSNSSFARRRQLDSSEQHIFLEEIRDGSHFFGWDEPNVNGKQIFDFEHIDRGALYYREYFEGRDHFNLFGIDEKYGPLGISIIREVLPRMAVLGHNTDANEKQNKKYQYRIIVRTCELYALRISVLENSIPSTSRHGSNRPLPFKDILEFCFPELNPQCLKHALTIPKIGEQLLKLDEQQLSLTYKIGLLYCKAGQTTEEEMYNNENGGSEFLEFCSVIADKVALRGFTGYRAQLDNKNDSTGQHSLYTNFHGREIMFHVSTELPFTAHDRQQLLRKRHIGNDIVTVIFQEEGSEPFTPKIMRSHFQHVFVVVRVEKPHTEDTRYSIAVSRSRDVPSFGPPIPPNKFYKNAAFREFLLSKLINGENAAHKSDKFTHMARRTRYEYLKDLATNQVSQQTLEPSNKFAFTFGAKKKEKTHPPVSPEIWLQGGLVWSVKYDFEHEGAASSAFLSISTKCITFVDQSTQDVILSIPCKSVLGWRPTSHTLKIFYDVGKLAFFTMSDEDANELSYVMHRLKAVTTGCETQDLTLKRNNDGQLGFHVFYEGLVAEVEPYGLAWQGGLRKGSRLLEISEYAVGSMSHDRMIMMLKRPGAVRIVVLPPAPDGQPRNYKAVRNMRRYSSMTSIYSMSTSNANMNDEPYAGGTSSSSTEESPNETTTTTNDSTPTQNRVHKRRSLSHEGTSLRKHSQSTASDDYSSNEQSGSQRAKNSSTTPLKKSTNATKISQERLLTSRSASDMTEMSMPFSTMPQKVVIPKKRDPISPVNSFDHELGELERQLTNTRKSIDAKFYKSLANSSSPFFRPSKPPGLMSPVETTSQSENELIPRSEDSADDSASNVTTGHNTAAIFNSFDSNDMTISMNPDESVTRMAKTELLPYHNDGPGDPPKVANCRESLEVSLESNKLEESTVYITPASPSKPPRQVLRNAEPITFEIDARGGHVKKLEATSTSIDEKVSAKGPDNERSESSASDITVELRNKSGSRETLDSDSSRKGSLVRTKVRDASDIIYERSKGRDSPVNTRREVKVRTSVDHTASLEPNSEHRKLTQKYSHDARLQTSSPAPEHEEKSTKVKSHTSPKLHARENIVKALGGIVSKGSKAFKSPSTDRKGKPGVILDDSLTDTFAKLDAAFGFKGSPSSPDNGQRDDKRKRRRNPKRRSRNYEPPTSDSDDDDSSPESRRRSGIRIQLKKNDDPETASLNSKSEAEQSLEAAISDFHISLSSMPERKASHKRTYSTPYYPPYNSDNNDAKNAPRVLNHSSRASSHRNSYGREQRSKSQDYTPQSRRPLSDYSGSSSKSGGRENDSSLKRRSEAKISLTSLRPWSPPLRRVEPSSCIMQHVKERSTSQKRDNIVTKPKALTIDTKSSSHSKDEVIEYEEQIITETIAIEDQLSPLPGGPTPRPIKFGSSRYTNSLPGRSHKRRKAAAQKNSEEAGLRSKSTSCIPLAVRGLDLAATENTVNGPATKEDLKVMIAVMEEELEEERREKQQLAEELDRSKKEKEVILEQSKQAASQLRKFTALFLDASPKEIEKAKQKYNDTR